MTSKEKDFADLILEYLQEECLRMKLSREKLVEMYPELLSEEITSEIS